MKTGEAAEEESDATGEATEMGEHVGKGEGEGTKEASNDMGEDEPSVGKTEVRGPCGDGAMRRIEALR